MEEIRADVVGLGSDRFSTEHRCIPSNLSFSNLSNDALMELPFRSTVALLLRRKFTTLVCRSLSLL